MRRPPSARAELLSAHVILIDYEHQDEPDPDDPVRRHEFSPGVELWVLPSGELLLRRVDGRPLWKRFTG